MRKWIIGLIVPIALGGFLDFIKVVNPLYVTAVITLGILVPIGLISVVLDHNKKAKEKEYR